MRFIFAMQSPVAYPLNGPAPTGTIVKNTLTGRRRKVETMMGTVRKVRPVMKTCAGGRRRRSGTGKGIIPQSASRRFH